MFQRKTTGLMNRLITLPHYWVIVQNFCPLYLNLHQPQIWLCSQNLFLIIPNFFLQQSSPQPNYFWGELSSLGSNQKIDSFSIHNAPFHSRLPPHFLKSRSLHTHYSAFLLRNSASVQAEEERTQQQQLQLIPGICMEEHRDGEAFGQRRVSVPQVV